MALQKKLTSMGIEKLISSAYTPEENGRSERANRTFMEAVRSIIAHAGFSKQFRLEFLRTAAHIRNCIAKPEKYCTPHEKLIGY